MMKLVFVILSFNHPDLTRRCVNSVIEAGAGWDAIYLIHNGSQPGFVRLLKEEFPAIRHVEIALNRGFSGGANAGLQAAFDHSADCVLFLTNDTIIEKMNEGALKEFVAANPACLLAPKIERRATGQIDSWGAAVKLSRGRLRHLRDSGLMRPRSERYYVPGTGFLLSRQAWQQTGQFDEGLGTYWEDVDFSLRAQRKGIFLGPTASVTLKHGIGKTCHGNPLYSVFYFNRNRRRVTWRHGSVKSRLSFSAVYFFDMSAKLTKYAVRGDRRRLNYLLQALVSW
jgi:N-acetylglucosaminyl-diphospho-decaprenol L-rhamnosyltransferase